MKRRIASMNGMARKMTPGTSVATGDRDPDLLPAALDGLDELAVDVAADAAGLLGDEPTEVARLPVQDQDRNESIERIHCVEAAPLAQRLDLAEALADAAADTRRVRARSCPCPERRAG